MDPVYPRIRTRLFVAFAPYSARDDITGLFVYDFPGLVVVRPTAYYAESSCLLLVTKLLYLVVYRLFVQ